MLLALVKGHATATIKDRSLNGQKMLVVLQLDAAGKPGGDPLICIDQLGAGAGDLVMISSDGLGVRERLASDNTPVRWFTLGIVDHAQAHVRYV